jgi:hypothetical protein
MNRSYRYVALLLQGETRRMRSAYYSSERQVGRVDTYAPQTLVDHVYRISSTNNDASDPLKFTRTASSSPDLIMNPSVRPVDYEAVRSKPHHEETSLGIPLHDKRTAKRKCTRITRIR